MSLIIFYYKLKLSTCTHAWYKEKPSFPLEPEQTWLHPENEQWLVRVTEERQGCLLAGSESGWGEKRRRGEGKSKRLINSVLGVENCRQKFLCATASLNPNATESSARAWIRSHQGIISLCVHVYAKVCVCIPHPSAKTHLLIFIQHSWHLCHPYKNSSQNESRHVTYTRLMCVFVYCEAELKVDCLCDRGQGRREVRRFWFWLVKP